MAFFYEADFSTGKPMIHIEMKLNGASPLKFHIVCQACTIFFEILFGGEITGIEKQNVTPS